jgi:hypothetical protein
MNKKLISVLLLLLVSMSSVYAITFSTRNIVEMILEVDVSLGNFTGTANATNPEEDDTMVLNFLIPPQADDQRLKLMFNADCIQGGANGTENYYLDVYCSDGSTDLIDLSLSDCENLAYEDLPYLWVDITNGTSGFQTVNDVQYSWFWCGIRRNVTNTDRIPTAFKLSIDSTGLSSPQEDLNTQQQRSSMTDVAQAISDLVSYNVQVWKILFNVFEIMVLLVAFIGIPIALIMIIRWAIQKVKGV